MSFDVDSLNGQQQPATSPSFGIQSLVLPNSKKRKEKKKAAMSSLFSAGAERRPGEKQTSARNGIPIGKSSSFHDGSAMATRSFSFYLHGEEAATLPSSKPPV